MKNIFLTWSVFLTLLSGPSGWAQDTSHSLTIFVDGVCGMCEERIEAAALQLAGVETASWEAGSRLLTVVLSDPDFDEMQLHYAVSGIGHDTRKLRASDEVYDRLHDCCKYRDEAIVAAHQPPPPVEGYVQEESGKDLQPLTGVNLYWLGTGIGATTDDRGYFRLERSPETDLLVVSYVGYAPDTIDLAGQSAVEITLSESVLLDEVEVTHRRRSTEVSFLDPMKVEHIGEKELLKAACCNLSESFETSPSVDVSFTDAVTGTRQIQLLGLAGPYTLITREQLPAVQGLASIYGLTYIPGTWIEGIQLSKGAGTVTNGFESMAGQINVEVRKPEESERLFLNLYANEGSRVEGNVHLAQKLGEHWSTGLLLHGRNNFYRHDRNDDGFLDMPLTKQFIALNRWKFLGDNGLRFQFGIKGIYLDNEGGQAETHGSTETPSDHHWATRLDTRRLEGWGKVGMVFGGKALQSVGLQLSGLTHRQDSYFGLRTYDAEQESLYANLLFQGLLGTTTHQYKAGASLRYDDYRETLDAQVFDRREITPGIFVEYTYSWLDRFNLVAGLRADHHNLFGLFLTPRLHLRYAIAEKTVVRLSGGRGQRTANILADNIGLLASSRQLLIEGDDSEKPYGLDAEVAWNYGLSLVQKLELNSREATLSLDFFRTDFENQIVVDLDADPQQARFYNLEGESFSNSVQAQFDYELFERFDLRLAYRWFDVKTTYGNTLLEKPLLAAHRAFLNLAYETKDQWKFDATLNWQGAKRIPFTASNPEAYRLAEYSPDFAVVNAQLSKGWGKQFEWYLGVENLLNFQQEDPILSSEDPFGPYFDASLVWGPIFGRTTYAGLRYRIE